MMKRVLVVGSNGQLARAFAECRAESPGLSIGFISRPEIDLRQIEAACSKLEPIPFDVLVNATAYNDVDGAESDFETARAINAEAPERLAKLAAERGAAIVHFSTDYVFAGDAAPYREDDPTGPICRYGESKLEGEQRVAAANRRHLIFRTAWLFSPFARNFAKTIVELAGQRDELSVVDDQRGSPTSALDLGRATLAAVGDLGREDSRFGTYHLVGDEHASRFEFARAILESSRKLGGPVCGLNAIASAAYASKARRPADTRLDCCRMQHAFGIRVSGFRGGLDAVIARILRPGST